MDQSADQLKIDTNTPGRRRPFQFGLKAMFVVTALIASCCGLVSLVTRSLDRTGPVTSQADWPHELRELLTVAEESKIPIESVQAYCADLSWHRTDFFKVTASPELLELMTRRWSLTSAGPQEVDFFWDGMPARWGPGARPPNAQYLVSPGFILDGPNYVVMVESQAEFLYVRYFDQW